VLRAKPLPTHHCHLLSCCDCCGLNRNCSSEQHTFELNAPDAHYVYLAGEMTQWDKSKLPMRKEGDGLWRVTVDLAKENGFTNTLWTANGWLTLSRPIMMLMGKAASIRSCCGCGRLGGASRGSKGRVETLMLESKAWGKSLKLNVYLPPDFVIGKRGRRQRLRALQLESRIQCLAS